MSGNVRIQTEECTGYRNEQQETSAAREHVHDRQQETGAAQEHVHDRQQMSGAARGDSHDQMQAPDTARQKTSVKWTPGQKQVIESRGTNLLVSAAAGSGKTAVLVERIIRMITDEENPLDIDKLLVMTFTNAAAAEMRERIGAAIEKKLEETPDNEHLQIQATLVHHAQITTIDSFCLNLIREHFNMLDLDPSFRIGDEGELMLLRQDVMGEMIEDYYTSGGEAFTRFVETYATGKSDGGIEDYIMQVYTFAQSNPYPEIWFDACLQELDAGNASGLEHFPWMQFLIEDLRGQVRELHVQIADAAEVCREDEYLVSYEPMLVDDGRQLAKILEAGDFPQICRHLGACTWMRLATVRGKDVDQEKKAYVTGCRDRVKKAVKNLKELYCMGEPEEMLADMAGTADSTRMLLELAREYGRRYQEKKRDRNLVDFNDLEHEALKVLIVSQDGRPKLPYQYTEAADTLSRRYEEVLVDEYQDSNLVQEALLQAVSRERFGQPNIFMVGDVKQSIYKFRLARPELFQEKYHSYADYDQAGDAPSRKIELHQNFRSRKKVLDGINDVFYRIMTENMGGICYTEETALHPGAVFPEVEKVNPAESAMQPDEISEAAAPAGHTADIPELLVVDTGSAALSQLDEEAADFTARELEAKLIVRKIREMTDSRSGLLVWDKRLGDSGGYRVAEYRDMVILLRSTTGWTETFLSVLMNEGIPAYAESRMGYFNTPEVETMLSLLSIIDNPMQDIPLAAVLKAPFIGVSDVELAQVMAAYKASAEKGQDRGIFAAVKLYLERMAAEEEAAEEAEEVRAAETRTPEEEVRAAETRNPEEEVRAVETGAAEMRAAETGAEPLPFIGGQESSWQLTQKLCRLTGLLTRFRRESTYLPIHELLYRIYEDTGYYDYVSAMPAGQTRRANLDMLVEKASEYERTSYRGLFHFVRYIENLKKYNTDFGEALVQGEEDNTVRIMSIHKSKGLEFPVVFLAGMGKKFNRQDVRGRILIDSDLGIGTDYLDLERRLKTTTLKKNVLRRKMDLDNLGEELRVLYVAMTRAREQLVMTGTDRYLEKSLEKYAQVPVVGGHAQIPYTILAAAGSYLDWLLMSMGAHRDDPVRISLVKVPVAELVGEELVRQLKNQQSRESLYRLGRQKGPGPAPQFRALLERYLDYQYPWQADITLHTKMSVSELKKLGQMTDEAETAGLEEVLESGSSVIKPSLPSDRVPVPKTFSPGISRFGATRGTAYHRALELLAFDQVKSSGDVEAFLRNMVDQNRFSREAYGLIDCRVIWRFLKSGLGRRMSQAQQEGRLHKEQQFVMGIPAREMDAADSDELVVIQGILDACFEEDGQLVLVDYKTDYVTSGQELVDRYKRQLEYYERALQQMTGKTVKEKIIYSLKLQEEICL